MAVPQNKQQLLDAICTGYQKLAADLAGVPAERAHEATLAGHVKDTQMCVADLVAYLIGWNLLVLKWCDGRARGMPVALPETGYQWNELGRLAQSFYAAHAAQPYPVLLAQFAQVQARIVALVKAHDDAALYGDPWYRQYTLGRMIQLNTASPYANARTRLRQWKKANALP